MEYLDLTRHDPESFEGKLISCNGCDYEIGAYVASGLERIVHKLWNRKSGLQRHVIKIWRSSDLGYVYSVSKGRAILMATGEIPPIVISIEIQIPGGTAELQPDAFGSHEERGGPSPALLEEADNLARATKFAEAISLYKRILTVNPYHTHALFKLAAAQAGSQDLGGAFVSMATAIDIEPNLVPYHYASMQYAGQLGLLRIGLQGFHRFKSLFPNVHDLDHLGAELYLASGDPETAIQCIQDCLLKDAEKEQLRRDAEAALTARSRATILVGKARTIIESGEREGVLELLWEAHTIYGKDPILSVNLGLALQRCGDFKKVTGLLMSVSCAVPEALVKVCYANAAFCEIKAGNSSEAMNLLEHTMDQLTREGGGEEPTDTEIWALPGEGIWAEERVVREEPVVSAGRLVACAVEQYSKKGKVSERVFRLAELYRKAAAVYAEQFPEKGSWVDEGD